MRGLYHKGDEPEDRERWRVVDEALSEVYMEGWLGTGAGVRVGAADGQSNFGYTSFPNGAQTSVRYELKVRQRWHGCGLYIKVWYTSPVGSTNTFSVTVGGRQTREGQNLLAPLSIFTTNLTPAGPAVAQDVKVYELTTATGIISAYFDVLSLRFVRNDPDANANELWQILAYYKVVEPS